MSVPEAGILSDEESVSLSAFPRSLKMWSVSAKISSGPTATALGAAALLAALATAAMAATAASGSAASDSAEDSAVSTLGGCSPLDSSLLDGLFIGVR